MILTTEQFAEIAGCTPYELRVAMTRCGVYEDSTGKPVYTAAQCQRLLDEVAIAKLQMVSARANADGRTVPLIRSEQLRQEFKKVQHRN